jgi:hypothetical protein
MEYFRHPLPQDEFPRQPVIIPSCSYGIWPINLACAGAAIDDATVQTL